MSGHSKWHSIKHKKAAADAKRGKLFTKLIKEITVAARIGGGDPDSNPRLRTAIAAAKAANMPHDNIKRAIMKGTGELPGTVYEEVTYEGYGPGGVAIMIHALTDNKNRTVSEVRHIFSKHNGNLGENGCVSWMFEKKGYFVIPKGDMEEEEIFEKAIDAGAEDIKDDGENFEVFCAPEDFEEVKKNLEDAGIKLEVAEISMIPQNTVKVSGKDAESLLKLMSALEDHDDIQNVYSNFDISAEELEKFGD